jgi:hypothetical protein
MGDLAMFAMFRNPQGTNQGTSGLQFFHTFEKNLVAGRLREAVS